MTVPTAESDQSEVVASRLYPTEIRELREVAAAQSRRVSQQIAHYVRLGLAADRAARAKGVVPRSVASLPISEELAHELLERPGFVTTSIDRG